MADHGPATLTGKIWEMIYAGRRSTANELRDGGYFNCAVSKDQLLLKQFDIISFIARKSLSAIKADNIRAVAGSLPWDESYKPSQTYGARLTASRDSKEGIHAVRETRDPAHGDNRRSATAAFADPVDTERSVGANRRTEALHDIEKGRQSMTSGRSAIHALVAAVAAFGIAVEAPSIAAAEYPEKPITLLIPYAPGGGTDLSARILGAEMEKLLGKPVVPTNKAGGGGAVALGELYAAKPDGYLIAVGTGSNTTIIPHATKVEYDALKFTYVGSYFAWPYMIVLNPKVPARNLKELSAWGKANPGALIVSTTGGFNIHEVSMALLAERGGGIDYRSLPSNSAAEATARILAGDANITFGSPATYLEHVKAGTLRALAIVSDVVGPELASLNLEKTQDALGFSLINRTVVIAPPGLPEPIRAKLEATFKSAVENPDVVKKVNALGFPIFYKPGREALKETQEIYDTYGAIIKRLLAARK